MKVTALILSLVIDPTTQFAIRPSFVPRAVGTFLRSSEVDAPSDVETEDLTPDASSVEPLSIRDELLYTAKTLVEDSPTGIFITTPLGIEKITSAASRLEATTPSMTEVEKALLVGDWELLATTRTLKSTAVKVPEGVRKLPFLKAPKLNDTIRNSITVLQSIRSEAEESNEVDRIDHVIQYTPLTLSDFIPEDSPLSAIRSWNVNPLEVSKSKITLIHDAEVESVEPTLTTKLGLKSVVVNVAGTSQYLEADGADILGLNIPSLGDFANTGSFDTTYVDENVRVTKNTVGVLEYVRVFVRKGFEMDDIMDAGYEAMMQRTEEEEKTEVETRLEKIGDSVSNVVGAIETLDKDFRNVVEKDIGSVGEAVGGVRDSIVESVKDVQSVVEDDLKKVGKAVDDVRAAVVGETLETEDDVVVDVDAVDDAEGEAPPVETETDVGNDIETEEDDAPTEI